MLPYCFSQWMLRYTFPPTVYKAPFPLHPHQYLLFVFFLIISIPTGVREYLIVVLICISLMISDTEHIFMCLLAICTFSLEKYVFSFSVRFLIGLLGYLMYSCMICFCMLNINHLSLIIISKYFLPFSRLSFSSVSGYLCCAKAVRLIRSHLFTFGFISFRR